MITMRVMALTAAAMAAPAGAQTDWGHAQRIEIGLASFKYDPATITLRHGQPYLLHFANRSGGGHDFVAKDFFAAATMPAADRALVKGGGVDVDGNGTVDIRLVVPQPGTYEVHCSHFMHSTFGMKGRIVVS